MKQADPFYKTARWLRIRDRVLRRDKYLCAESRRYGRMIPATTVHHIFPREDFPQYQYEYWNLISLSSAAHDAMHDRVTGALSNKGKEWMRRTARERGIDL